MTEWLVRRYEGLLGTIVRRPGLTVVIAVVAIAASAGSLRQLVKDPSVDAFIPADHPSFVAAEEAKEIFGLADPIVVALVWEEPNAVFRPDNLSLISALHDAFELLPNVRYGGVTSLASESYVSSDRNVAVLRYIPGPEPDDKQAEAAKAGWRDMRPHQGTLVTEDGSGAAILIELENGRESDETYHAVLDVLINNDLGEARYHVAGLGAVVGFLSETISNDVRALVPLIYVVVLVIILLAFRSFRALVVPLPVVVGAVVGSLGVMATLGIPYFAITSALPVIVVAVSVADSIHILSAFRDVSLPRTSLEAQVLAAMRQVAAPITLTTVTTMLSFAAIAVASIMPPLVYFAWFASLGIGIAWLLSLTVVPAVMVLLRLRLPAAGQAGSSPLPRLAGHVLAHAGRFAWVIVPTVVLAVLLALQVRVDRSLVQSFAPTSPIRVADEQINTRFAGTAFLDVMVHAPDGNGLLAPSVMARIAALQDYMEGLPFVRKTVAITDYLGQVHRMFDHPGTSGRNLPDDRESYAQYLLVYESSSTPDALSQQIDAGYQTALVRGILNSRYSSEEVAAVRQLERYVERQFGDDGLSATLSGRVNTRYHWMNRLAATHVAGVLLSIVTVFLVSAMLFRSVFAALTAITPVIVCIVCVYAAMSLKGAHLEPATSMFAAISIGVGVDYAIHLVYRVRAELGAGMSLAPAVVNAAATTGRACFFNATALGLGFAVLTMSDLMTLKNFGALIAVAAFASFVAAFVLVPLIFTLRRSVQNWRSIRKIGSTALIAAAVLLMLPDDSAIADDSGKDLARKVFERDEPRYMRRTVDMELISARGASRKREARVVRARDVESRRALIVFTAPKNIRETAFLSHERTDTSKDNRWLFLPATGRSRRLPGAERGDYFLGTDFTYADIQSELKFDLDDYAFSDLGPDQRQPRLRVLEGRAASEAIARELGYRGFTAHVDTETWIPTRIEFSDRRGQPLKVVTVSGIVKIGQYDVAMTIEVEHLRTGHRTIFRYRDVEFPEALDVSVFESGSLRRGLLARL